MVEIYINGRFLTQPLTGVQRYAMELVKALDVLIGEGEIDAQECSYSLLAPRGATTVLDLKHIPVRMVGRLGGYLWEQIELPRYARHGALVNLCNMGPLLKENQVVTVHDAAVFAMPGTFSFAFRTWYCAALKCLSKRSRQLVTVSQFSRVALARHLWCSQEKIAVVYHGAEHLGRVSADRDFLQSVGLQNMPFFLAVGSMNFRKNFQVIIKAGSLLEDSDTTIAIAGAVNPRIFGNVNTALPPSFRHVGHVTDGQLKALYKGAQGFIFPSLYEGFGLPALEAMACGCPVIAADIPPLHEVCGDAALYCDPGRPEDIAQKMRTLVSDNELRAELRKRGLVRARQFTWEKCARETSAIIRQAVLA